MTFRSIDFERPTSISCVEARSVSTALYDVAIVLLLLLLSRSSVAPTHTWGTACGSRHTLPGAASYCTKPYVSGMGECPRLRETSASQTLTVEDWRHAMVIGASSDVISTAAFVLFLASADLVVPVAHRM